MNTAATLAPLVGNEHLTSDAVFDAIHAAGSILNDSDRESELALEIAIRLLEARRAGRLPEGSEDAVEFLAEECGLYPYVDPGKFDLLTQSVIEAHGIDLRERVYLHAKQMQVLLWLLDGDNVILSAPTSFGKSLLVDALLQSTKPRTVVMILPTIALLDECRRRLVSTFGQTYAVLTNIADEYDSSRPTIFVLTQERFLRRKDIEEIDLLFVDEFYKLDPQRDDGRYETLNLALYKALPRSKQCFMAGPHIRSIELGLRWSGNFRFVQTDYRTVTVNVVDRSKTERQEAFLADLKSVGDESSLVFTATPGTARQLMNDILEAGIAYTSEYGPKLGQWIAENYHEDWLVAQGAKKGIAVHHGRLPRSLAQLFVQLFDAKSIKVLICTSTLIEGVNTSAANVFIYDKKINRTDFDFFSFANIRGRVGRMMRHFVGNAFLYHEAPAAIETSVHIPILADPDSASDYLLMNVDGNQLSPAGRERQSALPLDTGLSETLIREHGLLGIDVLIELSERVKEMLASDNDWLVWKGFPDKKQRVALADLALLVMHKRGDRPGVHTSKQVAWAWTQLSSIRSFPGFLRWFVRTFGRDSAEDGLDSAFQFLQACEFSFPRAMAAIETVVNESVTDAQADFGAYMYAMEHWFRPVWMKQFDEMGVPIPLAERLRHLIGSANSRKEAAAALRASGWAIDPTLSEIDRFIVQSALPSL